MSKTTSPKALLALLSGNPTLSRLTREARKAASDDSQTPAMADPLDCLPPALRERVTLVEDSLRWLAIAETSATAQLLRFHLPKLQQELLEVIRKYVEVNQDQVEVALDNNGNCSVLELNITLPDR